MRERVLKVLKEVLPEIDFESSKTLASDGILDSLAITTVIATLSMEFDVRIPFEEIDEQNFNSLDAIVDLIERL